MLYPSTNLNLLFRNFRLLMEYIIYFQVSVDVFSLVSLQTRNHNKSQLATGIEELWDLWYDGVKALGQGTLLCVGNDPKNLLRIFFLHDDSRPLIVSGSLPDQVRAVKIQ